MVAQPATSETAKNRLRRTINWTGAFWVASGVPALVLFSLGGVAATTGNLSVLIWTISILLGFVQSFTYAEIAGLFPNKSGGASIYGAVAWVPYGKIFAPLSVWCNWIAWSPTLALGCSIAAAYVLNAWAPLPTPDSPEVLRWLNSHPEFVGTLSEKLAAAIQANAPAVRTWSLLESKFANIGFSLNAAFFIGLAFMFSVFAVQHGGILRTAHVQKLLGLVVIVPLAIVALVPLLTGKIDPSNFLPFLPPAEIGLTKVGSWNLAGLTLAMGGLFIAAWSTYAFETAVCYTSEFQDPAQDTFRAIFYSGLLCIALFVLVPFTFHGVLGWNGVLAPSIVDGFGVAQAMGRMVGGGPLVERGLVLLMLLALMLAIMTAMAGSSRTLYQGSVDGWLPRYLSQLNAHRAPVRAMWTDLGLNVVILAVACADSASFFFMLAISNCGYILFNFLNLNAGWIHRLDRPDWARPYRAPTWLLGIGALCGFVNMAFMGAGAKVWNAYALWVGLFVSVLILPVFWYRHFVQDNGAFPKSADEFADLDAVAAIRRRAGILPYLAIAIGIAVMLVANAFFRL